MASGKLGSADLAAATDTLVYTVPAATVSTVNIRVSNRNNVPARIRVSLTAGGAPANADYITYDKSIEAFGILEETGLVCSGGEEVHIYSNTSGVSVRVHGFEGGV